MEEQGQIRRRVVLVPCPYQGHISPMLQLGTILYSKGFSITVVHTHFNAPNTFNHPEFKFQAIPDGLTNDYISSESVSAILLLVNMNCRVPFHECLVQMMNQRDQGDDILCIVYDECMYFAEAAAYQLKLQSIILRTSNAATQISRIAILQLKQEGYLPLKDSTRLHDPVPGLYPLRFKDLPFSKVGIPENFLRLIGKIYNIGSSSAVIWNTMNCLEQSSLPQLQQQCQVPIFPIGPLHKFAPSSSASLLDEDWSCISWLNKQAPNSVIYVSLGSIASMAEKELEEMARGLVNSKQPFLLVIRPSSIDVPEGIELLPDGLKEAVAKNGFIVKWAPQKEVLSHIAVGGFWSHCGWNSTLESISEGVPMICMPSFGDQRVNARYVSHVWRIGLELENDLERGEVERAVRRLMVDEEGMEMRKRAKELKQMVELSFGKCGSSYNSLNEFSDFISLF